MRRRSLPVMAAASVVSLVMWGAAPGLHAQSFGEHARVAAAKANTRGFLAADFDLAYSDGEDAVDCPSGFVLNPVESYFALHPEKRTEKGIADFPGDTEDLMFFIYYGSKAGERENRDRRIHDPCTHPEEFPEFAGHPLIEHNGKVEGLDLDGSDGRTVTRGTCPHQNFTNAEDQQNVDNQLWRVLGCAKGFRMRNSLGRIARDDIKQGSQNLLIEITGLDDERNDATIELGIYSGADGARVGADGNIMPGTSLRTVTDKKYHARLRGEIKDGVLTTVVAKDPIHIKQAVFAGTSPDIVMEDVRVRLELLPDGRAKGIIAGYFDIDTYYAFDMQHATLAGALGRGHTCPGVLTNMRKLADGHRDPKTGQCTAISFAYLVDLIPTFVIHPEATTAERAAPTREGK